MRTEAGRAGGVDSLTAGTLLDEDVRRRTAHRGARVAHGGERRAVLAAGAANLGIAVAKFAGYALTGAASLLAEGIHSVADTANQALLLLGDARAKRAPSDSHPFGYARERYFWAFVVSVVLFTAGGLFALYEGVDKLRHPHEPSDLGIAVAILLAAIVFEGLSLRTAVREARTSKEPGSSWIQFVRRSKSAELPVVLLEDVGALIGLVIALFGVVLSKVTDEPRFDAMGSLGIGVLLVVIAMVLASEMRSLLIGEAAAPGDVGTVEAVIRADPRVVRLLDVRTQQMGPQELLVGVELELDPTLTGVQLTVALEEIEHAVRAAVPEARQIYMEPHTAG
jgi:cation diffusion facilitator family transporter